MLIYFFFFLLVVNHFFFSLSFLISQPFFGPHYCYKLMLSASTSKTHLQNSLLCLPYQLLFSSPSSLTLQFPTVFLSPNTPIFASQNSFLFQTDYLSWCKEFKHKDCCFYCGNLHYYILSCTMCSWSWRITNYLVEKQAFISWISLLFESFCVISFFLFFNHLLSFYGELFVSVFDCNLYLFSFPGDEIKKAKVDNWRLICLHTIHFLSRPAIVQSILLIILMLRFAFLFLFSWPYSFCPRQTMKKMRQLSDL